MILGFILGAIICYSVTHNVFIAIVGGVAGYFLFNNLLRFNQPTSFVDKALIDNAFFKAIYPLMGLIAKADGAVSKSEIDSAEKLFNAMSLNAEQRQEAITLFQSGVKGEINVDNVVNEFLSVCSPYKDLKRLLLVYLISLAYADGDFHHCEEKTLAEIATKLGYSNFAFNQLLGMVKAQFHFEQKKQEQNQASSTVNLQQAYKAIGVQPTATDKEVKTAYRKLMSQYHPDKLSGQGVPAHVIEVATEKSQEVQAAYALIKKSRA